VESEWSERLVVRVSRMLLRFASRRLARYRQSAWLAEWAGELWALERSGTGGAGLLRFALAGVAESVWERRRDDGWMGGLVQDIRQALRRQVRAPVFSAVIVLVLGLGIGANASLFSALDAALLAPPPYPEAERLVSADLLLAARADAPQDTMPWSYPKFELARERLDALESLAGYFVRTGTLAGDGGAARIGVEHVTPSYFVLLGTRPAAGRLFDAQEDDPAAAATVVLGHALWTARYGADPRVVGRTIRLDGALLEIVGVAPAGFRGLTGGADVFVPVAGLAAMGGARRLTNPWSHWLRGIGRLESGVTLEQARTEATALGVALTEIYPDPSGGGAHGVALVPFLGARVNPMARLAVTMASAAALVLLLIACTNVAGLLVARSFARRTDVAVRAALGAGQGRLSREFLIEGLLVAAAGGALGVLFAFGGARVVASAVRYALDTAGTRGIQFLNPDSFGVNGPVLVVSVGLAALTGLLFGWLPARASTRHDLVADLRGGRGAVGTTGGTGRSMLVAGQLALTLVLLAGAGLMAASFARLSSIDVGFHNHDVLTLRFDHGPGSTREANVLFEEQLLENVRALPGVLLAAVAPCPPLAGRCEVVGIRRIDDGPVIDYGDMQGMLAYAVSEDYFATLGIAVRQGRTFGAGDGEDAPPVAIVNEAAAREHFAGSALRRMAVTHELTPDDGAMAEVIGVVADVRYGALVEPAMPAVYFSTRQAPSSYGTLFVQTSGDPYDLVSALRREVAALDADLPLYDVTTMADRYAAATARTRIVLGLLSAFALAGMLLSAIGLYGVVSYAVVQRTREMGLRMALGAPTRDVLRLVIARPVRLALYGVALGLAVTLVVTRYVTALLYGTAPADGRILLGVTLLLVAVALAAAWVPATRATRVDPATALRGD
jgi:predicted permease